MPISERTVKLVVAAVLATLLADWLGLSYASSAGIIALLSLLDTRISSLQTAAKRLAATLLALTLAAVTFFYLSFSIWSLGVYLLLYVPLTYRFKWEAGLAPATVLVTHLLVEHSLALSLLGNELLLFLIGAGSALVCNLYMPSHDKQIEAYHAQVEELLKGILLRFETLLLNGDGRNEARLITQLDQLLQEALAVVYLDRHNQVFHQTNYQVHYFEMRAAQNQILRTMARNINTCHLEGQESMILSSLFERTASQITRDNSGKELLEDIQLFRDLFRTRPLPQTREEFETRATLFQLLHDLERFILLKVDFYRTYTPQETSNDAT